MIKIKSDISNHSTEIKYLKVNDSQWPCQAAMLDVNHFKHIVFYYNCQISIIFRGFIKLITIHKMSQEVLD